MGGSLGAVSPQWDRLERLVPLPRLSAWELIKKVETAHQTSVSLLWPASAIVATCNR